MYGTGYRWGVYSSCRCVHRPLLRTDSLMHQSGGRLVPGIEARASLEERLAGGRLGTVLFDMDGTLLDSLDQHWRGLGMALSEWGFEAPSHSQVRRVIGLTGREAVLMLGLGVSADLAQAVLMRWVECMKRFSSLARPFAGVLPMLHQLRAAGYSMGIVTSRSRDSFDSTPAAVTLASLVDTVVTYDDTVEHKPDPAPLLWALRALATSVDASVFVGDSSCDVEAGRRAGCCTALAVWDNAGIPQAGGSVASVVLTSPEELTTLLRQR